MSAQLLICKFAFYTHFYFIFTNGSRDLHGSLAHSLSRPDTGLLSNKETCLYFPMPYFARFL